MVRKVEPEDRCELLPSSTNVLPTEVYPFQSDRLADFLRTDAEAMAALPFNRRDRYLDYARMLELVRGFGPLFQAKPELTAVVKRAMILYSKK